MNNSVTITPNTTAVVNKSIKVKVTYCDDPTGMSDDSEITIELPTGFCLLCYHDGKEVSLLSRIMPFIREETGIEDGYITVWKVYTL